MTERLITLCIAIFVLVVAPVATDAAGQAQNQGQQEPQEPPTQEEEEEVAIPSYAETIVVTATRTEVQILDAPATVSVITSDIIANSPAQNFGDLLSSVPGMNVSQKFLGYTGCHLPVDLPHSVAVAPKIHGPARMLQSSALCRKRRRPGVLQSSDVIRSCSDDERKRPKLEEDRARPTREDAGVSTSTSPATRSGCRDAKSRAIQPP